MFPDSKILNCFNCDPMKKILFMALMVSVALISCNQTKEEKTNGDKQEKTQTDPEADVKATTLSVVGQEVPPFSFQTTEGTNYSTEKLEGKIVLLNFFATWCPSCMKEMPALQEKVWEEYKGNDEFFMVSLGREHNMKEMKEFKAEKGYDFHFAPDTARAIYGQFAEKYIPRNVLIDREGKIIYQCAGYKKEDFQQMLELIEQKL